jgi:drug/metabolite transporter (DMT)-like permease
MTKEHYGFLFGLLSALMSAVSALFIKLAVSVPNETMVFFRFFVAFLFVLPGVLLGRVRLHPKSVSKHIARGLAGLGSIYCFFYSVKYLPLVDAVTASNTAPLFMPLVVFFWLKIIIPKARWWALLIGFVGILVVLRPGEELGQGFMFVGLLGGLFSAFAQVGIRQLSKIESTETIMTYYFLISAIVSFPPMLFSWQPIEDPMIWLYLFLLALASLVFQYCIVKSLTHAPATKVSTMTYLSVIFSGFFGWWFFGEIPDSWSLSGIVLIVAGGLLALFSKETTRKRKGYTEMS